MHIKFSVAELYKNGLTESQIQYKIRAHEEKCRDNRTKGTDFEQIPLGLCKIDS